MKSLLLKLLTASAVAVFFTIRSLLGLRAIAAWPQIMHSPTATK